MVQIRFYQTRLDFPLGYEPYRLVVNDDSFKSIRF